MSRAVGDSVPALGRPILPGCKRATQLARIYTVRMANALAAKHPEAVLYQHVDDMIVNIKCKSDERMAEVVTAFINDFKEMEDELSMKISENCHRP